MKFFSLCRLLLILLVSPSLLISCKSSKDLSENRYCPNKVFRCINEKKTLEIITNRGSLILEIDGNLAPLTSGNFLDLAGKGIYNKTTFNQVIKKPKPFVIRGGNPSIRIDSYGNNKTEIENYIDPVKGTVRFIPLEIALNNEPYPRYNQLMKKQTIEKISLKHTKGSIAMLRSEPLDSASAQFYISLRDLPELDGRYAVFGHVIRGLDILEKIEEGDYILSIGSI